MTDYVNRSLSLIGDAYRALLELLASLFALVMLPGYMGGRWIVLKVKGLVKA